MLYISILTSLISFFLCNTFTIHSSFTAISLAFDTGSADTFPFSCGDGTAPAFCCHLSPARAHDTMSIYRQKAVPSLLEDCCPLRPWAASPPTLQLRKNSCHPEAEETNNISYNRSISIMHKFLHHFSCSARG